jgi:hypothetical protein
MFLTPPHYLERQEASHDFFYKNDTEEDIVLTLHNSSCGCTKVKIVPERIAPGESATISLAYDLGYAQVSRSETVIINTNQEHLKQLAYRLKVTTYPRLEIMRTEYKEIVCEPGKSKPLTVLCRAYRPKSEVNSDPMTLFTLSDRMIVHPSQMADRETLVNDVIVSENKYELELFSPSPFDSKYDCNGYYATAILKNSQHWIEFPIRWKPNQYIEADKLAVFFNCTLDIIEDEQITLTGKAAFSIISVQTEKGMCEVHHDVQRRSNQHQVTVSANMKLTPESPTTNKDVIIFSTDHPLQPQVRVNVSFLPPFRE